MTLDHKPFSRGCWEVTWEHAGDLTRTEVSQVDAHDPDDAAFVVWESDEGYGEVGRIVSIRRRPELESRCHG